MARNGGSGLTRRQVVAACAALLTMPSFAARAQTPQSRAKLIAYLTTQGEKAATDAGYLLAFREAMKDKGYIEDKDYTLDRRFADGETIRVPALAQEVVNLK